MNSIYRDGRDDQPKAEIPAILLKPETACKSLSMSRSTLEKNLFPNGLRIPYFRNGSRLFFDVASLQEWARRQIAKQQEGAA